ncbi:MAG: response regulator [Anaerolinea sp.]|nr:response regulator [Anaerolinea sp.]MCC6972958.1 response regulator [Anaerolineae bacterium]CAG0955584.1 DNA-binding transcriptional regulator NtrC [Anaerolineae bacterium]
MPLALVVEDDADIRLLFADALDARGISSITAESADEAIALLQTATPDVALIDMNMPTKPGSVVLEYINQTPRLKRTKRIVITANALAESVVEGIGTDLFLVKPVSIRELLTLVHRLIESEDRDGA